MGKIIFINLLFLSCENLGKYYKIVSYTDNFSIMLIISYLYIINVMI